jgi:carbon-monoxide dehydrogenase large subunit
MSADLESEHREAEIGKSRERPEDVPLLRGEAKYTDDFERTDALYMAILRSQYGHARLEDVDVSDAAALDGVAAVYTADDLEATDGAGVVRPISSLTGVDDPDSPTRARSPLRAPDRPLLASDRVHYTGEPVAVVLAEDRYVANDALDRIDVEYERLEAVTHPEEALEPDAPAVHESVPDNLAFDWEAGDESATETAFEDADRTVEVEIAHQRISPTSMEPRTALAEYDAESGKLTVRMGTQGPHRVKTLLHEALGVPEERIQVIAPEVGGGFGCKSKFYPAEPLAAWCSLQVERPVKWQATRTESHRSDIHGRGRTVDAQLAFDDDGTIRGLKVDSHANLGAYVSRGAPGTRTGSFVDVLPGQYEIPAVHCRVRGIFTTTTPIDSYRGSSRPMSILTIERLVALAAKDLGVDPAEFRRQNFVAPEQFPYPTPVGEVYDSGEYERAMDRALELADYEEARQRQADLREEGRYLGIGLCGVMDNAGTGSTESARIRFDPSGSVTAFCGTADQGQGHRTVFAQLVADLLGVPFEDVQIKEGDTDDVPVGGGASGSRSVVMGGEALRAAAEDLIDTARAVAGDELGADPDALAFEEGTFTAGDDRERSIDLQELARLSYWEEDQGALEGAATRTPDATFPFGMHVAVVEVEPDTGEVEIDRYVAVDDCGVPLNPKLVEGQIVGGVVNGLGQALYENAIYDENGTLVTGSMQDYAVPRAEHVPEIVTDHTVTPSPYNELGVKGAGESGATGSPAAIANAVADALEPLGIDHVDVPVTPESLWQQIQDAQE